MLGGMETDRRGGGVAVHDAEIDIAERGVEGAGIGVKMDHASD